VTDDESGESMELMEEMPLKELGDAAVGEISAWLTEGSRELIPETSEAYWKERSEIDHHHHIHF